MLKVNQSPIEQIREEFYSKYGVDVNIELNVHGVDEAKALEIMTDFTNNPTYGESKNYSWHTHEEINDHGCFRVNAFHKHKGVR